MTECENGGQIEKERPSEKVDEPAKEVPKKPPRPQPPYKLAGENSQCGRLYPDGHLCHLVRINPEDPNSPCVLHEWEDLYGPEED